MGYCAALQQVCELDDDSLEIIDAEGMEYEGLSFLQDANDRCEIILQWIQRLVVDAHEEGTIKIAPPILSRVYQQLGIGIVNLTNVRKIKEIPFPFPYAQMITCMMIVHWVISPLLASQVIETSHWAATLCFFVTVSYWSLLHIALEIDQPFGADPNDLPVKGMQKDFNRSLLQLLDDRAQTPPSYTFAADRLNRSVNDLFEDSGTVLKTRPNPVNDDYESRKSIFDLMGLQQLRASLHHSRSDSMTSRSSKRSAGLPSIPSSSLGSASRRSSDSTFDEQTRRSTMASMNARLSQRTSQQSINNIDVQRSEISTTNDGRQRSWPSQSPSGTSSRGERSSSFRYDVEREDLHRNSTGTSTGSFDGRPIASNSIGDRGTVSSRHEASNAMRLRSSSGFASSADVSNCRVIPAGSPLEAVHTIDGVVNAEIDHPVESRTI